MAYAYRRTIHLADTDAAGVVYFAQLLHICHEAYEICLIGNGMDWSGLLREGPLPCPLSIVPSIFAANHLGAIA